MLGAKTPSEQILQFVLLIMLFVASMLYINENSGPLLDNKLVPLHKSARLYGLTRQEGQGEVLPCE